MIAQSPLINKTLLSLTYAQTSTIPGVDEIRYELMRKSLATNVATIFIIFSCIILLVLVFVKITKRKQLIQENEISKLKNERDRLQFDKNILSGECQMLHNTIESEKQLPPEIEDAIRKRIECLNSLLTKTIINRTANNDDIRKILADAISNRQEFINSNRLAFKASHPRFIDFLERHELSENEINYACLYAIGLRGKDIGEFIQLRSHYSISSDIRRKLNLDEHSTNLGIHLRNLLQTL